MRTILAISVLALAGCASTTDLHSSAVDQTAHSSKPLANVSQCIQMQLSVAPIADTDGNTTFVIKNGYQAPIGLLTLTPVTDGTTVELRRANSLVGGGGWQKCL